MTKNTRQSIPKRRYSGARNSTVRPVARADAPDHKGATEPIIFTIGHSNRTIEDFIELLKTHRLEQVIDIRTIPRSRHNPQFNSDALAESLSKHNIAYIHLAKLGGLRHARADSTNLAWRNSSFRGFADYMETEEFEDGLDHALALAREKRSALMCAEAVPWRCHRSLVSDALTARHITVKHIVSASTPKPHSITSFARITNGHVTYPASEPLFENNSD